ncbi:MAG TPA: bacillithiol biosynthesis cysteine-adding enzyme BshC, partial [Polyangia bacterium]
ASGSAAVVTGQQVGLFLGPLYTFYKAASAIAIARALTVETGIPCVPIFWLQTEDHDFAEIDHCLVPREDGSALRLSISDGTGAVGRASLAARRLGPDISLQLDALADALAHQPHAAELLALLRDSYRPGESPGRAFGRTLAALFAEEGLLVFDPRRPEVARLAAPIVRTALVDHERIEALLAERGRALRQSGFDEQVRPRPGSPLPFFHLGDANGPRFRLTRGAHGFSCAGADEPLTSDALLEILERDPLRFSTSALLRPIVESALLPAAVYVGGPSEVGYLAQLAPLFSHFGLTPPLVAPRARFRLIPSQARTLLDKLGLTPAGVERSRDELLRALSSSTENSAESSSPSSAWLVEWERRLDAWVAAPPLDPRLLRDAERARRSVRHALARLERRVGQSRAARDTTLAERVTRLQRWLYPDAPQERVYSLPYFAARYGARALVGTVLAALDPLSPDVRDLFL